MKKVIIAALAVTALTAPAFAGGRGGPSHSGDRGSLGVDVGIGTGKGGLIGSLLGGDRGHGSTGLGVNVGVNTGKGGVVGLLLGGGRDSSRGHGW